MNRTTDHDFALSFAGEDRAYVEMVAEQLRSRGVSVFYDRYEQANLWGEDLYVHLTDVYRRARFMLMFISVHYKDKIWANHERQAAQSRAIEGTRDYILPARFDDTEIPGVLPTTGYIDLRASSPVEVALLVCQKLGRKPLETKMDHVPSPKNPALIGEASFNYASYNGRYRIGDNHFEFETRWSKASDTSIHCYTDSTNLHGIALAPKHAVVSDISSAANLDFTSRVRSPEIGQTVILQNANGIFTAIRILQIADDSRGDHEDHLRFQYWILPDGTSDFSGCEP